MREPSTAIAIFVKTPGLSPIKTRLAYSIGVSKEEEFHVLSSKAVEAIVKTARISYPLIEPYWAVAEPEGVRHSNWSRFKTIDQGEGSMGDRLNHVFHLLFEKHQSVIFIGADSPQIKSDLLVNAATQLGSSEYSRPPIVLGRCNDGGFYLFGSSVYIPASIWLNTPYSQKNTADGLVKHLSQKGLSVQDLPTLSDIDTLQDLLTFYEFYENETGLLPEQKMLLRWTNRLRIERMHSNEQNRF